MRKIVSFLIVTFLMLALLSVAASAVTTVPLLAGQDIIVGEVNVWNDGTNLCVEYNITVDGWVITETHLAVAEVEYDDGEIIPPPVDVIPQTKKRNPIPGHFPYGDDELGIYDAEGNLVGGEDSYEECILLSDLEVEVGDIVYIAAQASLLNLNNIVDYVPDPVTGEPGVPIYQQETGWGEGDEFADDRNWSMYFEFVIPEPEPVP